MNMWDSERRKLIQGIFYVYIYHFMYIRIIPLFFARKVTAKHYSVKWFVKTVSFRKRERKNYTKLVAHSDLGLSKFHAYLNAYYILSSFSSSSSSFFFTKRGHKNLNSKSNRKACELMRVKTLLLSLSLSLVYLYR